MFLLHCICLEVMTSVVQFQFWLVLVLILGVVIGKKTQTVKFWKKHQDWNQLKIETRTKTRIGNQALG